MVLNGRHPAGTSFEVLNSGRFSLSRFAADLLGFMIGSYLISALGRVVDSTLGDPQPFPHIETLIVAFSAGSACWFLSRKFGNVGLLGLKIHAASALIGFGASMVLVSLLYVLVYRRPPIDFGSAVIAVPLLTLLILPVLVLFRLSSIPVAGIFDRSEVD